MRISFQLGFPFLGSSARFNLYTMVLLVLRVAFFLQGSRLPPVKHHLGRATKHQNRQDAFFQPFHSTLRPLTRGCEPRPEPGASSARRSGGGTTRRERRRFVRSRWPSRRSPPPRWLGGEARLRCSLQPVDVERTSQEELRRTYLRVADFRSEGGFHTNSIAGAKG